MRATGSIPDRRVLPRRSPRLRCSLTTVLCKAGAIPTLRGSSLGACGASPAGLHLTARRLRSPLYLLAILAWCCCPTSVSAAPLAWREVAPGLEYARVGVSPEGVAGRVHAFRIDPARYRIDPVLAKDLGVKSATAREMAMKRGALLAINGGFFSPTFEPLGLRIQSGRERVPLKNTSWWGIFYVQDGGASAISARSEFVPNPSIQMAVQCGPRLVVNGTIPSLKPGLAERTGIGITHTGRIVIAVTERTPMETATFAALFRTPAAEGGFDCPNALNLDGGGSTQFYAKLKGFALDLPGFTPVTDAIAVFAK